MTAYGYTRVSTCTQADEGVSLDQQQKQIKGYAMMQGYEIDDADIFVEGGVSGSIPLHEREQGALLMGKVKKGDVIIAPRLDRCFRSALDALDTAKKLKDMGVSLVLLDLGGDVTGNGISKMFFTILAAVAEQEREFVRERVAAVKKNEKSKGRYLGGVVPWAYTVSHDGLLVPHHQRDEMLARMREMKADGASLRAIASEIAEAYQVCITHAGVAKLLAVK